MRLCFFGENQMVVGEQDVPCEIEMKSIRKGKMVFPFCGSLWPELLEYLDGTIDYDGCGAHLTVNFQNKYATLHIHGVTCMGDEVHQHALVLLSDEERSTIVRYFLEHSSEELGLNPRVYLLQYKYAANYMAGKYIY